MKALKVIGIILLIIVGLVLIIPLFLADNVKVSHSQLIKAKPITIFQQVNTLSNWDNWSPFDDDPEMNVVYEGAKSGVDAKMVWSGKDSGTLTILESIPYKSIRTDIQFPDGGADGSWDFDETPDGVIVTWATHIVDLKYPMGRLFGLAFEAMLRPTLEKGLTDLKALTEGMPVPPEISIVTTEAQPSLVILDSTTIDGIGELLGKNYGTLMTYIMKKQIPMAGKPFAIYHNWDPNGIIKISAGIPVEKKVKGFKTISYYELPAGKAVFATHFGAYDTGDTHWAIEDYLNDFNIETQDFIWEVYITDPTTEPDTAKWQTDIYYPIK